MGGNGHDDEEEGNEDSSPESNVVPYEGLNEKQEKITGEDFPCVVLEICDGCSWCATCLKEGRGILGRCPECGRQTSQIRMTIDEMCRFEKDDRRGVTLRFGRGLPMR
ncbi:hypothetical protein [Nitrososphaera sp.]|uniref:hypothetical protein n=1 Tax=Nitrososphaera sp. TaxID=1971748 RepID=UPI00307EFF95